MANETVWLFNLLIPARGAEGKLDCCLLTLSVFTPFLLYLINFHASGPLPGKCTNKEECPLFPSSMQKMASGKDEVLLYPHMVAISGKSLRYLGCFGSRAVILSSRLKSVILFQNLCCIFYQDTNGSGFGFLGGQLPSSVLF